jgi:hypothetical protein
LALPRVAFITWPTSHCEDLLVAGAELLGLFRVRGQHLVDRRDE